ncbi:Coenzyme F420 hydrogenase/dehydrogenase, beta subunit C-terminal domain [Kordiimonas laminariae]|uniref:Coenzyme F420 hydrogenase/dehydrogenase, beta subunit C-terminal domain n=1 Tax=Kordiimonas laminariae TaxID=2917717 RepID=UPI001FF1DAA4|nr:Coenzyme F420 hydrogenase/dehydrogenase, beta subunit C-terminal domain [Kordiimonas laminariae]MCK0067845.1 Coenzyme F420 hydrogenase/dehydrogenase, beta subunit C-terminal domain [Kordiimonas laminariae]
MSELEKILSSRLCNGCGACAAIAPKHIQMHETEDEARRPKVCSKLSEQLEAHIIGHCPGANNEQANIETGDLTATAWGPILEVWEGYADDAEIRFKGSSGGAITALALYCLEQRNFTNALHVKANPDKPKYNMAAFSTNKGELMEGAGSRYAPASICDALPELEKTEGQSVVIGKPCDIEGVQKVSRQNQLMKNKIGLTLSIFCAGTPSHKGTDNLLNHLGATDDRTLKNLQYRGNGWPGNMQAEWETANGETHTFETTYADGWGNILQKQRQWRCHTCADHTGELADISVGDPWQNPPEEEEHGKSLIVVRTARGQRIIREAIKTGYLRAIPQKPEILFAAQPNLFATKGAVWGRSLALKLAGLKAPKLTKASLICWWKLPLKSKVQSIAGTMKRIIVKQLFLAKKITFQNHEGTAQ